MNPGLFSLYSDAPPGVQARIRARWLSCPFPAVARRVPAAGRILEVGCGHGLFALQMALEEPARRVVAIDVDVQKVVLGQRAAKVAARRGAVADVQLSPPGDIPPGPWDGIVLVDVLAGLSAEAQAGLVNTCAEELAAGGVLVVKEVVGLAGWKTRWSELQQQAAAALARRSSRDDGEASPLSAARLREWMAGLDLDVTEEEIHRGYPQAHHLVVGRRPTLADLRDR